MAQPPLCDLSTFGFTVNKWIGHCFNGDGDVLAARGNDASRLAIKKITIGSDDEWQGVLDELRHIRALRHPHLLPLHSSFVCGDSVYMATPMCTLGSALDVILTSYPTGLPEKAVSLLLYQLLKAVSYVHAQGIVHRSIRASHMLLDSSGMLKLTGFRCAIAVPKNGRLTEFERSLEGSLLWLAPEVLAQDLNGYGTRSDVYSIGITLCELANGFPPFSDMEPLQTLYEKGRGTTPKLLDASTLPALDESAHARREFSSSFHDVTELCLKASQFTRPDTGSLLSHPFIRRRKKTVCELLPLAKNTELVNRVSERLATTLSHVDAPEWD